MVQQSPQQPGRAGAGAVGVFPSPASTCVIVKGRQADDCRQQEEITVFDGGKVVQNIEALTKDNVVSFISLSQTCSKHTALLWMEKRGGGRLMHWRIRWRKATEMILIVARVLRRTIKKITRNGSYRRRERWDDTSTGVVHVTMTIVGEDWRKWNDKINTFTGIHRLSARNDCSFRALLSTFADTRSESRYTLVVFKLYIVYCLHESLFCSSKKVDQS